MSRLPLVDPDELPEEYQGVKDLPQAYKDYFVTNQRINSSRVIRSLGHNPAVQEFHVNAYLSLWNEEVTGLTPRETELVILSTGLAFDSEYEWVSHTPTALAMGVTEEELIALRDGDFENLREKDAALVEYVLAVVDMNMTDALHERLADFYDERTIVGILALTGYYALCAIVIEGLGMAAADTEEIGGRAIE